MSKYWGGGVHPHTPPVATALVVIWSWKALKSIIKAIQITKTFLYSCFLESYTLMNIILKIISHLLASLLIAIQLDLCV